MKRDRSLLGRWWWTIDRWVFISLLALMGLGVLLNFAASPSVAQKLGLNPFFFVYRYIAMLAPSILMMVGVSLLSLHNIRKFSILIFIIGLFLILGTIWGGVEIKGARRWIGMGGFSFQPSELTKPAFAVLSAWLIAQKRQKHDFPGLSSSFFLLCILCFLLLLQPDLGMTIVTVCIWLAQLFVAGIPLIWVGVLTALGGAGFFGAYFFLPHVTKRVDQFFSPTPETSQHDLYQVTKSLQAFMNGGLFGRGPGEGIVKKHIPDVHADFIFAVAGEEFGLILCLGIIFIFLFIIVRSLLRAMNDSSIFVMLATTGLIAQFCFQTLINLASSLHLIPTKGMTLPFISYGGSSSIALGIGMGILLALTRKRHGFVEEI